jgi:hypothetical protein
MVAWRVAMVLVLLSAFGQPQAQQQGQAQTPVTLPVAGPDTLGLDRPMTPLTGPVTVGLAPWLPFTRFCDVKQDVMSIGGQPVLASGTTCATITTEPVEAGWRRLTATVTEGDLTGASLVVEVSPSREVRGASYKASPGADLSTQQARVWNQILDGRLRTYLLPDPVKILRQGEPIEGSGRMPTIEGASGAKDVTVTCRVEGGSTVAGCGVVVTACTLELPFNFTDHSAGLEGAMTVTLAFWEAADIATGAALRSIATAKLHGTRTERGRTIPISGTSLRRVTLD